MRVNDAASRLRLSVGTRHDGLHSLSPTYAQLSLALAPGESVRAEAGAMVSYSADINIGTGTEGGVVKSLLQSLLGGESFFMNTSTTDEGGSVELAPMLSSDVQHYRLADETLFVQSSSFLAAEPGVDVDMKSGGARTFFTGERLFYAALTARPVVAHAVPARPDSGPSIHLDTPRTSVIHSPGVA